MLDNRPQSLFALITAIKIDAGCTEAAEYITSNGLLKKREKRELFNKLNLNPNRMWLEEYYRSLLLDEIPEMGVPESLSGLPTEIPVNAISLVRQAENCLEHQRYEDAYKISRQAYTIDPFDKRGLLVYIASMVDLCLKTELYYLGHELTNSHPKESISWYAVGCYYWCCKKLEMAQKHLQKATKLDKRFSQAWVALGLVLTAQEQSEDSISAFRTASRLMPGNHKPLVYMAKEMAKTNSFSMALHVLKSALEVCSTDASLFNELGVILLRLERFDDAIRSFEKAKSLLSFHGDTGAPTSITSSSTCIEEILCNYATSLRRSGNYDDALIWYRMCLSMNPLDADTHAHIAFTLHLSRRFDDAITCYHKTLAIRPGFTFCSEMLHRALTDREMYEMQPSTAFGSDSLHFSSFQPSKDNMDTSGLIKEGDVDISNEDVDNSINNSNNLGGLESTIQRSSLSYASPHSAYAGSFISDYS